MFPTLPENTEAALENYLKEMKEVDQTEKAPKIVGIVVGNMCLKTKPCQHVVEMVFADGRREKKRMDAADVALAFKNANLTIPDHFVNDVAHF